MIDGANNEIRSQPEMNTTQVAGFEIEHNGRNLPFEVVEITSRTDLHPKDVNFHVLYCGIVVGEVFGHEMDNNGEISFQADTTVKEPLTIAHGIPYVIARSIAEIVLQKDLPWLSSTALNTASRKMYHYIETANDDPKSPYFRKFVVETIRDSAGSIRQYRIRKNILPNNP